MTSAMGVLLLLAGTTEGLDPQEVLRRADPGRFSQQPFRALLRLGQSEGAPEAHEIEVWHAGEDSTLVRFLGEKQRGKFLLRRAGEMWLISPRTKRPTRLSPAFRLYGGATLDEIVGRSHVLAYAVAELHEEEGPQGAELALDLRARDDKAILPRARLVVGRADLRPLRAEYALRSGKPATAVAFEQWDGKRPRRFVVRDLLHVKASVIVDVVEIEERAVPAALFDLEDGTARDRLPAVPPRSP